MNEFASPSVHALVDAARFGQVPRVEALLAQGLRPPPGLAHEVLTYGPRRAHLVSDDEWDDPAAVNALMVCLLAAGMDPEARNAEGDTPWLAALRHRDGLHARLWQAADVDLQARSAADEGPLLTLTHWGRSSSPTSVRRSSGKGDMWSLLRYAWSCGLPLDEVGPDGRLWDAWAPDGLVWPDAMRAELSALRLAHGLHSFSASAPSRRVRL